VLRVAIAGFGFMGKKHLSCYKALPKVRVVAVCDNDKKLFHNNRRAIGNIGQVDSSLDISEVSTHTDYDKMLAEQKLDAVSITLPTFMHRDFTVKALDAGINVLCEKPMAMDVVQCREMIAASKANRKVLQIGHCIRFWPEYIKAKELIESGKYGKVLSATFRRIGAIPGWSWKNWLINAKQSGGAIMDLHIHDSDYVQFLFGLPHAVRSQAVTGPSGGFDYITTQYNYKDNKVVAAEGGFVMSPDFKFEMSFIISLEKATILYDCRQTSAFQLCLAKGGTLTPKVESGDGWSREIEHFTKKISGKKVPDVITTLDSLNAIKIVLAEKQSAQTKKEVIIR
jgi:predicted dehydrogenase